MPLKSRVAVRIISYLGKMIVSLKVYYQVNRVCERHEKNHRLTGWQILIKAVMGQQAVNGHDGRNNKTSYIERYQ